MTFPKEMNLSIPRYQPDVQKYIPIHVHSSFSSYDGCGTVEEIAEVASQLGMAGVSLSDHGNMSGAYSFIRECKERNLKPIIGCEFYLNSERHSEKKDRENEHLCLFAMNNIGYKNILKILHDALVNGFYYRGRTDLDYVAANSEGVICTTACLQSPIISPFLKGDPQQAIRNMEDLKDAFGDRLYIELQFNELEEQKRAIPWLLKLAEKYNVKTVYGLDAHYVYRNDVYVQDVLKMNQAKVNIYDSDYQKYLMTARRLFIKPYAVAFNEPFKFGYNVTRRQVYRALLNTNEILERTNFELEFGQHSPKFIHRGETVDSGASLWKLLNKKFEEKVEAGKIPASKREIYYARMENEYDVILQKNYCDYFLIIWDLIESSVKKGIFRGAGRGSAAGCLVSYVLGIIDVDPVRHELLFERFIDIERRDPPDIDIDWEHERGSEVEEYLKGKYGSDKVAHICTYSFWQIKSAIAEVFKTFGEDLSKINRLIKFLKIDEDRLRDVKNPVQAFDKAIEKARMECIDPVANSLLARQSDLGLQVVRRLVGKVKNLGQHAAGCAITPRPIHEYIPTVRHKGEILTGFMQGGDGRTELDELGIIKIDNLKVRTATVIKETIRLVKERSGTDLNLVIWDLNLEDPKVYDYYQRGYTEGVFQLESDDITEYVKKLKPDSFEELRAIMALYRPGTLSSGEAERYIKRKHGKEKIEYLHPSLEKYIGKSYGCFLYQEQMMMIMNQLAGLSMGEILKDLKLLKKSYQTEGDTRVDAVVQKFKSGLMHVSEFTEEQAQKLTEIMREFYGYVFNKSHATAYALCSFQTMWLKRYYPVEFFCALLSKTENQKVEKKAGQTEIKIKKYVSGARKIGIQIEPPLFGQSGVDFTIEGNKLIRAGIHFIVGIGKTAAEILKVEGTEFKDFALSNLNFGKMNKKKVKTLIGAGFFPKENRKVLSHAWDKFISSKVRNAETLEKSIQDTVVEIGNSDFTEKEKMRFQIQAFRFYLSGHPISIASVQDKISNYNQKVEDEDKSIKYMIRTPSKLNALKQKQALLAGLITQVKVTVPKSGPSAGELMAIVEIEDESDKSKILVWPEWFTIPFYREMLVTGEVLVFKVKRKTRTADKNVYELDSKSSKGLMAKLDSI